MEEAKLTISKSGLPAPQSEGATPHIILVALVKDPFSR